MRIYFRSADVARVWQHARKHEDAALKLRFSESGDVELRAAGGGSYARAHSVAEYAPGILPTDPFDPGDVAMLTRASLCCWEIIPARSARVGDTLPKKEGVCRLVSREGKQWSVMTWGPTEGGPSPPS